MDNDDDEKNGTSDIADQKKTAINNFVERSQCHTFSFLFLKKKCKFEVNGDI
jgi:hypothetical protein